MRISDWSSDVCSSDHTLPCSIQRPSDHALVPARIMLSAAFAARQAEADKRDPHHHRHDRAEVTDPREQERGSNKPRAERDVDEAKGASDFGGRSEEHKSELPSLMRISDAVFCLQ